MKIPKLLPPSGRFPIYAKVPDCESFVGEFTQESVEKAMREMRRLTTEQNNKMIPADLLKKWREEFRVPIVQQ